MISRVEKTVEFQKSGGLNCSQAILCAFGESVGLDAETAKVLGRPWGGGIAHMALTCGHLSGAVLVLAQAMNLKDEALARKNTFKAVQELFHRFKEKHGTTVCKKLLGADMTTQEGQAKIVEENLIAVHCYGFGRDVSEILEQLLEGNG